MPRDWPGSPGGTPRCRGTGPNSGLRVSPSRERSSTRHALPAGTLSRSTNRAGRRMGSVLRQRSRRLVEALSTGQDVVSRRRERAAWRRVRQAAVGVRHGLVGSGGRGAPACFVYQCRALAPWSARYDERCADRARRSARTESGWRRTIPHAVVVAGSASTPDAVVRIELATGTIETIKSSSAVDIADSFLSTPESVEFSSPDGHTSHAFYYPPRSGDYAAPDGERPPLILISHGGPTTATSAMLDLRVQFWTSRGFAVADVNYGGSSDLAAPPVSVSTVSGHRRCRRHGCSGAVPGGGRQAIQIAWRFVVAARAVTRRLPR